MFTEDSIHKEIERDCLFSLSNLLSSVKLANFSRRMFSFVAILRRKKRDGGGTQVFVHDQRVLLG